MDFEPERFGRCCLCPSRVFLAYLKYRQRGNVAWYLASLLLFLLALLGKLSVIALPVVLFSFDLFLEKRPFGRSIVDKIPFVLLAAIIAERWSMRSLEREHSLT